MDHQALESTLCERCSLLAFDESAAGCWAVTDENGVTRLVFDDDKLEWRYEEPRESFYYKLIRLRWHLDDNLPDLPQLSKSSRSGCDFCNSLLADLEAGQISGVLSDSFSIHDGPISLTAYLSLCEEGIEGLVIELVQNEAESEDERARVFFPIEASPSCHKWLGAEPARPDSYLTSENIGEIRQVLAECTAGCHPFEATFVPTRLIDVGTSLSDVPRLVLSSNFPMSAETKYAALSYCWGDREDAEAQLKTETATLEKRCEGIPCEIMTPAIKDAVELTKAIGLRYVWIDALCIIQDDTTDWSYESGQMGRVFHHAFVTFCGLSSTSCHESFLQRARRITVPFQSALIPEITGHLSVRIASRMDEAFDHRRGYSFDRLTSQWAERAWIYQEEKLSTRLLLFGATKMHFRCGTHQWSEGDDKLSHLDSSIISLHHRTIGIKQGKYPASSLYEDWNMLVDDYGHRDTTYETDRLPAISGLARLIWETLGDHYLAGLWKGDILNGLAWYGIPESYGLQNHLQIIREREYTAPSWSWASYEGAGIYSEHLGWKTVSDCTLLDADVKTDLQNPFGRVYSGYLRVRGKVTPIPASLSKIKPNGKQSFGWKLDSEGQHGGVTADLDWYQQGEEEEGLENLVMLLLHYRELIEESVNSHSSHTDSSDTDSSDTDSSDSLDETEQCEIEALMLYPTKIPDEYYRVGLVTSDGRAGYNLMRAWFESEGAEKVCTII